MANFQAGRLALSSGANDVAIDPSFPIGKQYGVIVPKCEKDGIAIGFSVTNVLYNQFTVTLDGDVDTFDYIAYVFEIEVPSLPETSASLLLLMRYYVETADPEQRKTPFSMAVEWLNNAQLDFCDYTQILQDVWSPTLKNSIALPDDFLMIVQERVKSPASDTIPLVPIDYHRAIFVTTWGGLTHYSIYNNKLYIWQAQTNDVTLTIPYIRKPLVITLSNFTDQGFEIPREFQTHLLSYMISRFYALQGDIQKSIYFKSEWKDYLIEDKREFEKRRYPLPKMVSNWI